VILVVIKCFNPSFIYDSNVVYSSLFYSKYLVASKKF